MLSCCFCLFLRRLPLLLLCHLLRCCGLRFPFEHQCFLLFFLAFQMTDDFLGERHRGFFPCLFFRGFAWLWRQIHVVRNTSKVEMTTACSREDSPVVLDAGPGEVVPDVAVVKDDQQGKSLL